jgi:IclR family transcriptional regulator, KDG regulon repressor
LTPTHFYIIGDKNIFETIVPQYGTKVNSANNVKSIVRAVDVLRAVASGADRITAISEVVKLSKGTVHRLLETLENTGLIKQMPITRKYYLGLLFLTLSASPHIVHQFLIQCALGEMRRMQKVTGKTVNLQIPFGFERVVLEEVEGNDTLKYVSGRGSVAPLGIGAAGRLLIAGMPESELEILLRNLPLFSEKSNRSNATELLTDLTRIKKEGYAVSFGERVKGSAAISVSIRNYICPVALSVLGPVESFNPILQSKMVIQLKRSAARISKNLEGKKS